jgi:DNA-binding winged helix-turn-helix (wHTH) protein
MSAVVYRFGPFELDPIKRRLFLRGKRVRIAGPQFALLTHFVTHPGVAFSKDALLDVGWGDQEISLNSLDQAIHRLRKLLRTRPKCCEIETAHQTYRFVGDVERAELTTPDGPLESELEPLLAWTQARMQLDTLNRAEIVRTRRNLEAVLRKAPQHARAHALLGMACALAYEASAVDKCRDTEALTAGLAYAQKGRELAPASAEAWSTLAYALSLNGQTALAVAAANQACDLEPDNWRHALRLAKVSWGEERIQAARRVLTLVPGLAQAHWLIATVLVARNALDRAREELQLGCAAQDVQGKGFLLPANGLYLLYGLVLAAQGREDDALEAFERELSCADTGQVYGPLCAANTCYAIGAIRWRQRRPDAANAAFEKARSIAPFHASATAALLGELPPSASPVDRVLGEAIVFARGNRHCDAARLCLAALAQAPPCAAGWILPVEPILNPPAHAGIWLETLALLRTRAA